MIQAKMSLTPQIVIPNAKDWLIWPMVRQSTKRLHSDLFFKVSTLSWCTTPHTWWQAPQHPPSFPFVLLRASLTSLSPSLGCQIYPSQSANSLSQPRWTDSFATRSRSTKPQKEAKTGKALFSFLIWTKTCLCQSTLQITQWIKKMTPPISPWISWLIQIRKVQKSTSRLCRHSKLLGLEATRWPQWRSSKAPAISLPCLMGTRDATLRNMKNAGGDHCLENASVFPGSLDTFRF